MKTIVMKKDCPVALNGIDVEMIFSGAELDALDEVADNLISGGYAEAKAISGYETKVITQEEVKEEAPAEEETPAEEKKKR